MYLLFNHVNRYIEEKMEINTWFLMILLTKNKELLKKYTDIWDGIKNEMKKINGGKENDYGKDYLKIKFGSDDDLPLNKLLIFFWRRW